jgi:hypothetical protein
LELQPNRKESKQTTTKHFNPFGWKIEEKNKPKSSLNYIKKKKKKKTLLPQTPIRLELQQTEKNQTKNFFLTPNQLKPN